ncbi:molybdenum ABC transporter permease [Thiohalorhabdus denitrificans]|uniref:Molybdenum transport system permease n=1 Tax=Thiohalorhabdus denitrificans TaxID=381306 RepID=A0A0P9EM51_9GAMM|nr:molybdate ABC transporter permease subunit [Thiohalorhabdus denitrificans]KPV39670.1 molybdenum ABC transporter permease [Thiohalorhabdus denitrificans]SCX94675.1 molybdate transport system permease protein [Thiohalorhabdus denitrificans]
MLESADLTALVTTLKLAGITTAILLLIGTPLAWWLGRTRARLKPAIEAVVALPLVLPPTVLGFYFLVALGPQGLIGGPLEALGIGALAFTFEGLVVASLVYSLPFVVQPLQDAFAGLDRRVQEASATLGAGPLDRFFTVTLPLARRGFLTATTLGFAHTLGEFGVVLMVGGNIPGETRVASIAIYDHVESLAYGQAHLLSGILLVFSFLLLLAVYTLNRRYQVVGL